MILSNIYNIYVYLSIYKSCDRSEYPDLIHHANEMFEMININYTSIGSPTLVLNYQSEEGELFKPEVRQL